jgi:hypothetical protein
MKNIQDVIKAKEQQLQQIQRELEALRVAARLLADDSDAPAARPATASSVPAPAAAAMVMRPTQAAAAPKESGTYVAASAWDVSKPQFP